MYIKNLGLTILSLAWLAQGQLSTSVGPTTSYKDKAAIKICNVKDYGATADGETDDGPAIQDTLNACCSGGLAYIPPGNYALGTFVSIKDCSGLAIQLDGTIIRDSDNDAAYMFAFRALDDFELFSGTSKGAIQGLGYRFLMNAEYGPRIWHFQDMHHFSIHGFATVDSPSYYFVFDTCHEGEIYNLIVRGVTAVGGTDAMDVSGSNLWFHDIEITNGDECITLKNPSTNMLIQSLYCNLSGGTAIGSLLHNVNISNILYQRLYMNQADPCFIKTKNGNGTVENIVWDTVIVKGGPYPLTIDAQWGDDSGSEGIDIHNLTFKNWHGTNIDDSRPVIRLQCDPDVPCYDIDLLDINLWTEDDDYVVWNCQNAYGDGNYCLKSTTKTTDLATYTTKITISSEPAYTTSSMSGDFSSNLPSTTAFSIPAVPTSFYPGARPSSKLLSLTTAAA